ncbi:hypothetical protein MNV49_005807 [Pseudohyphozyma bogoriensis]|nr:hypothetical protein MNV49_005807 [Pseudohyphozyma bogoriensis]
MEMLASPSRGLDEDESQSLKNPAIQAQFRAHIDAKLVSFHKTFPEGSVNSQKRKDELSIILLDLRKLREGCTAVRRVDAFTAEVYETSILYSISGENWPQLAACLPHLVLEIYPAILATSHSTATPSQSSAPTTEALTSTLSTLSLFSSPFSPTTSTHAYYFSLYLLYLTLHLSDLSAYHATLPLLQPPQPTHPALIFSHRVYTALLTGNYVALSKLLYPASSNSTPYVPTPTPYRTPSSSPSSPPDDFQLSLILPSLPRVREKAWSTLEKSYKVARDFENLEFMARMLLFEDGVKGREETKAFLRAKGRGV